MTTTKASSQTFPASVPTLDDVVAAVLASSTIKKHRRDDLASSVRTIGRILGQPLNRIPGDPQWLREPLQRVNLARAGISRGRFCNVQTDLKAALELSGIATERRRRMVPFSPAWEHLIRQLPPGPLHWNLARFARFCSGEGIAPEQVDDEVIARFRVALEVESIVKDPQQMVRTTIHRWNDAVGAIPGFPDNRLTPPPSIRQWWTLPVSAFQEGFQQDLSAYMEHLRGTDPLALDAIPRPLREVTVRHRAYQLRALGSAAVRAGRPTDKLTSLGSLLEQDTLVAAFRWLLGRGDGKPTGAIAGMAGALKAVARHWVKVTPTELESLNRILARLSFHYHGMTQKNRDQMRQFHDERNLAKLLRLPRVLLLEAARAPYPARAVALKVQLAVAILILLFTSIRISNLAGIRLGRNLVWSRSDRRGTPSLVFEESETKNGIVFEAPLPPEVARPLRDYLDRWHPLLAGPDSCWLFPGEQGRPKGRSLFSMQIKRIIFERTGIEMTPHTFRRLSTDIVLDELPGAYGLAARINGHRDVNTTYRVYSGTETAAAVRRYGEMVLRRARSGARRGARSEPRPGGKTRGRRPS